MSVNARLTDASGTTAFRYDNRNRLVEKATPQGTLLYAYDAHGSVTNISSTTPDGVRLSYSHDALNCYELFSHRIFPRSAVVRGLRFWPG